MGGWCKWGWIGDSHEGGWGRWMVYKRVAVGGQAIGSVGHICINPTQTQVGR